MIYQKALLLFFIPFNLFGQKTVIIGKVIDSESRRPIQFANVYTKNQVNGTVTNEMGIFRLFFDKPQDSLTISFVGYKSYSEKISEILTKDTLTVDLVELPTLLQSLEVIGQKPYTLLKIASQKTSASLIDPVLLNCYYREFQSKNGYFVKFADALVDYFVQRNIGEKGDIVTRVSESRAMSRKFPVEFKSMGDIKIPQPLDLEVLPQFFDAERKFSIIFKDGLDYDFEIFERTDTTRDIGYYTIKFTPKKSSEKVLYQGEFIIEKETNLIHSASYFLSEYHKKFGEIKNVLGVKFEVNSVKVYVQYQKVGDHCHLKYAKSSIGVRIYNKKDYDVTNEFISEMLANNVIAMRSLPFNKSEVYRKNSIYKRGNNFKTKFWEGQNGLVTTKQQDAIIQEFDVAIKK